MTELAARWVDTLFPGVGVRQWVLTVPWHRRWLLARKPELAKGVLSIALGVVFGYYRARARALGHDGAQTGSVTVVQRFGSALNLNLHFHALVLDGVYDGQGRFVRLPPPTTRDVEGLVEVLAFRVERWLCRRGHGPDEPEVELEPEDAQALLQAASAAGRTAMGGRRPKRVQVRGGRSYTLPPRCAAHAGYSLHGGTAVGASNREGLERLCRYIARPALGNRRLVQRADGKVQLTLKSPWSDGTTALLFTPAEFTERLAALVPPARRHTVLYHGVLAARSSLRRHIVPTPPPQPPEASLRLTHTPAPVPAAWRSWAELMRRVFDIRGFACPRCGEVMQLHAVVWPPATHVVLRSLRRSARGPPRQVRSVTAS